MTESDKISKLDGLKYFIDLDKFQESGRSFAAIAQHCLCSSCQERLASKLKNIDASLLLASIKDCCSKASTFIASSMPVLERIFRVFLAGGNKPLSLSELLNQLTAYSDTPILLSLQTLKRLLDNDTYYGFKQVSGAK